MINLFLFAALIQPDQDPIDTYIHWAEEHRYTRNAEETDAIFQLRRDIEQLSTAVDDIEREAKKQSKIKRRPKALGSKVTAQDVQEFWKDTRSVTDLKIEMQQKESLIRRYEARIREKDKKAYIPILEPKLKRYTLIDGEILAIIDKETMIVRYKSEHFNVEKFLILKGMPTKDLKVGGDIPKLSMFHFNETVGKTLVGHFMDREKVLTRYQKYVDKTRNL